MLRLVGRHCFECCVAGAQARNSPPSTPPRPLSRRPPQTISSSSVIFNAVADGTDLSNPAALSPWTGRSRASIVCAASSSPLALSCCFVHYRRRGLESLSSKPFQQASLTATFRLLSLYPSTNPYASQTSLAAQASRPTPTSLHLFAIRSISRRLYTRFWSGPEWLAFTMFLPQLRAAPQPPLNAATIHCTLADISRRSKGTNASLLP